MKGINIVDYAVLSVAGSVVGLADGTPALPDAANRVYLTVETDAIRWRADGTDPSTSEGHKLSSGDSISFMGANYRQLLEQIRFSKVSTTAALKITYYD